MIWLFILLIAWIAIALWPITLTLIGLFLLWLFLPEKKLGCYNNEVGGTADEWTLWGNGRSVCVKKFRTEKGRAKHRETCERRRRMHDYLRRQEEENKRRREQREQEQQQREQREKEEYEKEKREEREWNRYYRKQQKQYREQWDRIFEELYNSLGMHDLTKYYKVLDLDPNATLQQIKGRFRELVLKYHPDKCKNKKTAEKKFKKIVEAYEMIIRYREDDPEPGEPGEPGEPVVEKYPVKSTSNA